MNGSSLFVQWWSDPITFERTSNKSDQTNLIHFLKLCTCFDWKVLQPQQFFYMKKQHNELQSTIVGVLRFNQMPDIYTLIGLALIISGVLIVNLLGKTT